MGNLDDLLAEYAELPEYSEMPLENIDTISLFGNKPINIACTRGIMGEVETLLAAGADINNRGEHGYTPLHNAVEQGHLDVVRFLIEKGASPNPLNDDGDTLLALSEMLKKDEVTAFLKSI